MASISKRRRIDKDGKEVISWMGQINTKGMRKTFYGKTKREVEEKIKNYNTELHQYGSERVKTNITVADWVYKHLLTNKLPELAPGTFDLYMNIYNAHIKKSALGKMQLTDVTQIHVQEFLNAYPSLAYSTLKKFYLVLLSAFEAAIKNHIIRVNPAKGVIIPNKTKTPKQVEVLTLEQQKAYIKATEGEKYQLFYLTALFTGLRQGELIALKWKHVNLNKNIIHVNEIVQRSYVYDRYGNASKKTLTKAPKTKSSIREVPIPEFLAELLKEHKPLGETKIINQRYVFETSTGNCLTPTNVRKYHKRICESAKINPVTIKDEYGNLQTIYKGVSFHALRHTFATRSLEEGESIKLLQVILGHSDIETTLNIYTHVLEDTKAASAHKQHSLYHKLIQ